MSNGPKNAIFPAAAMGPGALQFAKGLAGLQLTTSGAGFGKGMSPIDVDPYGSVSEEAQFPWEVQAIKEAKAAKEYPTHVAIQQQLADRYKQFAGQAGGIPLAGTGLMSATEVQKFVPKSGPMSPEQKEWVDAARQRPEGYQAVVGALRQSGKFTEPELQQMAYELSPERQAAGAPEEDITAQPTRATTTTPAKKRRGRGGPRMPNELERLRSALQAKGGLEQQLLEAEKKIGDAKTAFLNARAGSYSGMRKGIVEISGHFTKKRNELKKLFGEKIDKVEKELQAIAGEKIDPNNYWKSMPTHQQVAHILAVTLAQMSGGEKTAARIHAQLDRMVQRDIDAQKVNLTNRKDLAKFAWGRNWKKFESEYGNLESAEKKMLANANMILSNRLFELADEYKGSIQGLMFKQVAAERQVKSLDWQYKATEAAISKVERKRARAAAARAKSKTKAMSAARAIHLGQGEKQKVLNMSSSDLLAAVEADPKRAKKLVIKANQILDPAPNVRDYYNDWKKLPWISKIGVATAKTVAPEQFEQAITGETGAFLDSGEEIALQATRAISGAGMSVDEKKTARQTLPGKEGLKSGARRAAIKARKMLKEAMAIRNRAITEGAEEIQIRLIDKKIKGLMDDYKVYERDAR